MTTEERIKRLETEICYLQKRIKKLENQKPEIHYHFTMITKTSPGIDDFFLPPNDNLC